MHNYDSKIQSKLLLEVFDLLSSKKFDTVEALIEKGLEEARFHKDDILEGLFLSAYGVFFRMQKDYKKSWRYYEEAEKKIPTDPTLKIINAQFLIHNFAQYDTALRKIKKALELSHLEIPSRHSLYTLQGLAYFKLRKYDEALHSLQNSIGNDFKGLQSAENLNFLLLNEFLQKKRFPNQCRDFLIKAKNFAISNHENEHLRIIEALLKEIEINEAE